MYCCLPKRKKYYISIFLYKFLEKVRPYITKQTTVLEKPISAEEKLAVTLRYLATGESMDSLMHQYRIHKVTVSRFIVSVCQAILEILKDETARQPEKA